MFPSSNSLCAVTDDNKVLNTFVVKLDSHPLATNRPLMSTLNLENEVNVKFEVDTAASHNVISTENYNKLQACLLKKK